MRRDGAQQAVARSDLRGLIDHGRYRRPPSRDHAAGTGVRIGLPWWPRDHAGGRARGRQERVAGQAARRLSARPARPAAIDVPGVRLVARRAADAPHRDDPVGLCVLRLWADVHVAFLRRQAHRRLRAVQLRVARARAALRGHPQRRPRDGEAGALRRGRRHQSLRADRVRRAARPAAEADRRRPHHRHRCAGLRRADARGGERRARRRDAALRAQGSRDGAGRAAAAVARTADGHDDRRVVPRRPAGGQRAARADGPDRRSAGAVT